MNWIELLGTTLIHFIWQGALLMGLAMLLLLALRNRSAQSRYVACCGVLLLMAASPVITALMLAPEFQATSIPLSIEGPVPHVELAPVSQIAQPPAKFDERLLRPVAIGWLIGVVILALRVLGGFLSLHGLRRSGHIPLPPELQTLFLELVRRMSLRKPPQIRISSRVAVPTVIGALRGMILIPASVASGMSPRMLETILAHELAHVARYDFLVNALQSMIEVALFYHPAVWWVSQRIREERENCCDDLVIATLSDRKTYARALTTLAELRGHSLAVRADGGELLVRIRRILGEKSMKSIVSPLPVAILLGALILVPTLQGYAATQDPKPVPAKKDLATPKPQAQKKSKPSKAVQPSSQVHPIEKAAKTTDVAPMPAEKVIRPMAKVSTSAPEDAQVAKTAARPHAITPLPGLQGTRSAKQYFIYQLSLEIESLLEQRQTLMHMSRTGELTIMDREMQLEALRHTAVSGDANIKEREIKLDALLNEKNAAESAIKVLEHNLLANAAKLQSLRDKLEVVSKS